MEEGVAVNELTVGRAVVDVEFTVTVTLAVLVPFAFVAVRVKRVEVARAPVTVLVPDTVPIVGLIESDVAPETVQPRVEVPFKATTVGAAVNREMVGRMPLTVVPEAMVDEAERLPPLSCATA